MQKPRYKDIEEIPFQIMPGRYFHAMIYLPVPPSEDHIMGGNLNGLIWRLEDEPESWRVVYRFRWYKSTRIESEESGDDFHWHRIHVWNITPDKILTDLKTLFTMWRKTVYGDLKPANEPDLIDTLEIKGDWRALYKAASEQNKPWLHVRKVAEMTPEQYEAITGEKFPGL